MPSSVLPPLRCAGRAVAAATRWRASDYGNLVDYIQASTYICEVNTGDSPHFWCGFIGPLRVTIRRFFFAR
jgi:hypothetical protein